MNIIEGIQKEQERCRELLITYEAIPTGHYGVAVISAAIKFGDSVMAGGDTVGMVKAYKDLLSCE